MTPEERAAVIMANLATMPVGSARWDHCNEMVVRQIRQAVAEAYEDAARMADEAKLESPDGSWSAYGMAKQIAAAIRARTEVKG